MHLLPINVELTPQEKTQLLPLQAQSRDKRTCDRIKAAFMPVVVRVLKILWPHD